MQGHSDKCFHTSVEVLKKKFLIKKPDSQGEDPCVLRILGNFGQGILIIVDIAIREKENIPGGTLWFKKVVRV